ncbi:hypothetical protein B0H13DRAFT_1923429 [Mycena leptocephala]|nr:hypothetical protein B0H13DRAFT_1923429 [Mycena leptocephala]
MHHLVLTILLKSFCGLLELILPPYPLTLQILQAAKDVDTPSRLTPLEILCDSEFLLEESLDPERSLSAPRARKYGARMANIKQEKNGSCGAMAQPDLFRHAPGHLSLSSIAEVYPHQCSTSSMEHAERHTSDTFTNNRDHRRSSRPQTPLRSAVGVGHSLNDLA